MGITYKTVIASAIGHFNDIQTALASKGAKYKGELIDAFKSDATLVPTDALDTIIEEQLQLKASGTYTAIGPVTNVDIGDKKYLTIGEGSAITPTNSTAISSTSTSLSGTTLTVQASVTPSVTAGWVSSGTAGTVKISGTVPTEEITAEDAGDVTPTAGKLLSKVTIGTGSLTATPSVSQLTYDGAYTNSAKPLTNDILLGAAPTNAGYYTVIMDPSVEINVSAAGWISSDKGTKTEADGDNVIRYIKKGSVTSENISFGETTTISAGYYASDITINNSVEAGSITATPSVSQSTYDGAYNESNTTNLLATDILAATAPNDGEYYTVVMNPSANITVDTSGYHSPTVGDRNVNVANATISKYIKKGSATQPSDEQTNATASLAGTTLTLSKEIEPIVTEGYIKQGTKGTITISGTVPTEEITAKDAGDVTPTAGKLLSKVKVPAGAFAEASVSGAKATVTVGTAGWFNIDDKVEVTIPDGQLTSVSKEDAESTTGSYAGHALLEAPVLASEGYLIIGAGYYPNSKISLATLIPDDENKENAGDGHLRDGFEAYDINGKKLVGTISDWSPNTTYFTSDNTGIGVVTGGTYVTSSQYIKTGSATTPTESGASTSTSLSGTTLTVSRLVTPTVSAGWVSSGTAGTVTITGEVPTEEIEASAAGEVIPTDSNHLLSKVTIKAGSLAATPSVSQSTFDGTSTTALTTDILVEAQPTDSDYYKVVMDPRVTVSLDSGWIDSENVTENSGTDVIRYIKKGSASVPTTISGEGGTVSVSNGTVTLTKKIEITPNATEGYITTGSATESTITLEGTIATTTLTSTVAKECSINNNSTSPTVSGDDAVVSDNESTPYDKYVVVRASSKGTASVGEGYIGADSIDFAASDTARIAALVEPAITASCTNAAATISVGTATTFNGTTGAIANADYVDPEDPSKYKSFNSSISGSVSGSGADFRDKYIIGGASASGSVSGTATANMSADATGATVDTYVEALFKRMLGQTYSSVDPDPAS